MRRSEKIYYDLTESNEYVELLNTRFYFSSSFNKERFLSGYQAYIKEEEDKIISKYNVKISIFSKKLLQNGKFGGILPM